MDILNTLANMRDNEQRLFLKNRTSIRKAYFIALQSTVGMVNYNETDDTFLDALDIKMEMLAARAGMATLDNDNLHVEENASDVFALVTRPAAKSESSNITAMNAMPAGPNWGNAEKVA